MSEITGKSTGTAHLYQGDALDFYDEWPEPTCIVVDGPYGIEGYPGDLASPKGLADWYRPHIVQWEKGSLPQTTLWFWGTEVGWANVHPVLTEHGWDYRSLQIWDKGKGHIAGNVNGKSIRGFPVVTEVCAHYTRRVEFANQSGESLSMKQWLRHEWKRSGLPLNRANDACGVADAATRKYLTLGPLWYFPPPDMMEQMAAYANEHGDPSGRPYFSLDGESPVSADEWKKMRAKWNHKHGVTNVWSEPTVRGEERVTAGSTGKAVHQNQKPLRLMTLIIEASSEPGDVVWEPFGGLCTGAVASVRTGRVCYAAEIDAETFRTAKRRLQEEANLFTPEPLATDCHA